MERIRLTPLKKQPKKTPEKRQKKGRAKVKKADPKQLALPLGKKPLPRVILPKAAPPAGPWDYHIVQKSTSLFLKELAEEKARPPVKKRKSTCPDCRKTFERVKGIAMIRCPYCCLEWARKTGERKGWRISGRFYPVPQAPQAVQDAPRTARTPRKRAG